MKRLAIGIITRNRSNMLEFALKHFKVYQPSLPYTLVVSDDDSEEAEHIRNMQLCQEYGVEYVYNTPRLGIAKNYNSAIDFFKEIPYDYMFLFNDDCFPQQEHWDDCFVDLVDEGIHHSQYLQPVSCVQVERHDKNYSVYTNCLGVCLFFSKKAIEKLKGMNPEFGIYGFEHAEMSYRANNIGLNNHIGKYISPNDATKFIYSMDIDLTWFNRKTELGDYEFEHKSSLEPERHLIDEYIAHNTHVFGRAVRG